MTTEEIIRMLRRDGYHDAADRMEQPVEQLGDAFQVRDDDWALPRHER